MPINTMAAYQTEKKNNILVATCRHILYRKKKKNSGKETLNEFEVHDYHLWRTDDDLLTQCDDGFIDRTRKKNMRTC